MPHNLPDSKAISMYLSGYRINKETKDLIPNYNNFFDSSEIHKLFYFQILF